MSQGIEVVYINIFINLTVATFSYIWNSFYSLQQMFRWRSCFSSMRWSYIYYGVFSIYIFAFLPPDMIKIILNCNFYFLSLVSENHSYTDIPNIYAFIYLFKNFNFDFPVQRNFTRQFGMGPSLIWVYFLLIFLPVSYAWIC